MNLKSFLKLTLILIVSSTIFSCSNDDNGSPETPDPSSSRSYHLVLGQGSIGESATYVQGVTVEKMQDPNATFSFNNFGFEVPSTRTARVYTSNDGNTLYNLNYGGGAVAKYNYNGGQNYALSLNTDIQAVMGTTNPRWTKIDDNYAMLQHVTTQHQYDDPTATSPVYLRTSTTVILALVNLSTMTIIQNTSFEFPWNQTEAAQGIYVSRIDAPVVSNGKLYYGAAKNKYDPITAANVTMVYQDAETLVVDYPSLKNPTTLRTNVGGAAGSTNGYRTPVAHIDEHGDTFQLVTSGDVSILKISNGVYDATYGKFDIKSLLGYTAEANTGWFYAGNGIGYIPVLNKDAGNSASANWGIVRVDLYNKTAVKMNIPLSLWLRQYQWASVIDGKVYMALTELGGEGNIYIFDPTSNDANGYTVGAKLQTGTDAFYLGIF
ncbi:MAG: hypothetical protein B7Z06_08610 [Flavobacteriales bacterium 32-35-8]|nr:MAG: hypothetical protein B7Z06_08610 [Flavobacteriales bacterium 32-35-8]